MTYLEKLKHPNWQKKRLEILNRDQFVCQTCYGEEKTLHVHHKFYDKNIENPWDYDEKYLVTLCCDCHLEIEESKKIIKTDVPNLLLSKLDANKYTYITVSGVIEEYTDVTKLSHLLWQNTNNEDKIMSFLKSLNNG